MVLRGDLDGDLVGGLNLGFLVMALLQLEHNELVADTCRRRKEEEEEEEACGGATGRLGDRRCKLHYELTVTQNHCFLFPCFLASLLPLLPCFLASLLLCFLGGLESRFGGILVGL